MSTVTVVQAARKYGDFYVPRFEITASGTGVSAGVLRDVSQVIYNDSITEIDSFDITVANWETDPNKRAFKYVGAETSVKGSSPQERLFFRGEWQDRILPSNGVTAATLDQYPRAMAPYLVELIKKRFVLGDFAKLAFSILIFLERPVRRRRYDQMDGIIRYP